MHPAFKHLKRSVALALFAAVAAISIALAPARPAQAQTGDVCWADPILTVNGKTVNVSAGVMGMPADVRANVQHAHFRIFLPRGVDARIVAYTGDYFTESAEIIYDGMLRYVPGGVIEMRVEVDFQATATMRALLAVSVDGSRQQVIGSGTTSMGVRGTYLIRP